MWIAYRKEIPKLTFRRLTLRELAPRQVSAREATAIAIDFKLYKRAGTRKEQDKKLFTHR